MEESSYTAVICKICPYCSGSGYASWASCYATCSSCKGSGYQQTVCLVGSETQPVKLVYPATEPCECWMSKELSFGIPENMLHIFQFCPWCGGKLKPKMESGNVKE